MRFIYLVVLPLVISVDYKLVDYEYQGLVLVKKLCPQLSFFDHFQTWCIGSNTSDQRFCPNGVQTDPCSGRIVQGTHPLGLKTLQKWKGIECVGKSFNHELHVYKLDLSNANLYCSFYDFPFEKFSRVDNIRLQNNNLHDGLPDSIYQLKKLRYLNVQNNQLHGALSPKIGLLSNLRTLSVAANLFEGRVPWTELENLKELRYLNLSRNSFSGTISTQLHLFPDLQVIDLSHNFFVGIFHLKNVPHKLKYLSIAMNSLQGNLPATLAQASGLEIVNVSFNMFLGELNVKFYGLQRLHQFDISYNMLYGTITYLPPMLKRRMKWYHFYGPNQTFWCPLPHLSPTDAHGFGWGELTCSCSPNSIHTSDGRCQQCRPGSQAISLDGFTRTACHHCPLGHVNPGGDDTYCKACPKGTYAPKKGLTRCTPTEPGMFTNTSGSIFPRACSPGMHSNTSRASSCVPCEKGTYAAQAGSKSCKKCPVGHFADKEGSLKCSKCPGGSIAPRAGAPRCLQCPRGHFALEGAVTCKQCPPGTFNNKLGQAECQKCFPGMFNAEIGRSTCEFCHEGSFSPKHGSTYCLPCKLGSYQNEHGMNHCEECAPGTYRDTDASNCTLVRNDANNYYETKCKSGCLPCPGGSTAKFEGQSQCVKCPPGTYYVNSTLCLECPEGFYSNSYGAKHCTPCIGGMKTYGPGNIKCYTLIIKAGWEYVELYRTHRHSRVQTFKKESPFSIKRCDPGFANDGSLVLCSPCLPGFYALRPGSASCLPCPPGTFTSSKHTIQCVPAAPGWFVKDEGSAVAQPCPPNSYSSRSGWTSCLNCTSLEFSTFPGSVKCLRPSDEYMVRPVAWPRGEVQLRGLYEVDETSLLILAESIEDVVAQLEKARHNVTIYNTQYLEDVQVTLLRFVVQPFDDRAKIVNAIYRALGHRFFRETLITRTAYASKELFETRKIMTAWFRWNFFNVKVGLLDPLYTVIESPCIPGYALDSENGTRCIPCPPGWFTNAFASRQCFPCPIHHINTKFASKRCRRCPKNHRTIKPGSNTCVKCQWFQFDLSDDQCVRAVINAYSIPLQVLIFFTLWWCISRYRRRRKQAAANHKRNRALMDAIRGGKKLEAFESDMEPITAQSLISKYYTPQED